jgi:hypothetical protein
MKVGILFIVCFVFQLASSQSNPTIQPDALNEGRRITQELCSETYFGRGYIKSGDSLAAQFLVKEFQKRGLKQISDSYLQPFTFDVNTFPGKMEVKLGDKILKPGIDFLVDPASGSSNRLLKFKYLSRKDYKNPNFWSVAMAEMKEDATYNAIIFDCSSTAKDTLNEIKILSRQLAEIFDVVIITEEKFTFSVENEQYNHGLFYIQSAVFDKNLIIQTNIEAKFKKNHVANNVIAKIPAKGFFKKTIVFSAHYDHLGGMGNSTYFPGGNDNASGTSMLFVLADYFKQNPVDYNLVFIAFAGEEAGLIGSKYFVDHPLFKLKKIKFLLNLDIMGSGEEGVTVVNGSVFKTQFDQLIKINEEKHLLKEIKIRGKAANSDHYWFSEKNVPAFFIYTMGENKHYHDVLDTYEALSFNEYLDIVTLISTFVKTMD